MFPFCSLPPCATLREFPVAAVSPAMIRPLRVLAFCLAAAGCQSDVPEASHDVDHPFERVLAIDEPPLTMAERARLNLDARLRQTRTVHSVVASLSEIGIVCATERRMLRCTYVRLHATRGKGLLTRWLVRFVADIDVTQSRTRVRRVCLYWTVLNTPANSPPLEYAPMCDSAQP